MGEEALEEAAALIAARDYTQASLRAEAALPRFAGYPRALLVSGVARLLAGEPARAAGHIVAALALEPDPDEWLVLKALITTPDVQADLRRRIDALAVAVMASGDGFGPPDPEPGPPGAILLAFCYRWTGQNLWVLRALRTDALRAHPLTESERSAARHLNSLIVAETPWLQLAPVLPAPDASEPGFFDDAPVEPPDETRERADDPWNEPAMGAETPTSARTPRVLSFAFDLGSSVLVGDGAQVLAPRLSFGISIDGLIGRWIIRAQYQSASFETRRLVNAEVLGSTIVTLPQGASLRGNVWGLGFGYRFLELPYFELSALAGYRYIDISTAFGLSFYDSFAQYARGHGPMVELRADVPLRLGGVDVLFGLTGGYGVMFLKEVTGLAADAHQFSLAGRVGFRF